MRGGSGESLSWKGQQKWKRGGGKCGVSGVWVTREQGNLRRRNRAWAEESGSGRWGQERCWQGCWWEPEGRVKKQETPGR